MPGPATAGSLLRSTPLSSSATILELLFPCDCAQHIGAMLVVKELATAEIRSKSRNFSGRVFADSADQIIGHANVEHGVVIISHDIDPEIVGSHHLES